ncbi:MAG: virulence RhuM family protein [Clostridiaceae bacterium]|nr:virulence RhuM family protein [Clostridiaceae bacterium]
MNYVGKEDKLGEKSVCRKLRRSGLNTFLQFNEYEILNNSGKVTAEIAKIFAESEFGKYRIVQYRLFESDFDRLLKESEGKE